MVYTIKAGKGRKRKKITGNFKTKSSAKKSLRKINKMKFDKFDNPRISKL